MYIEEPKNKTSSELCFIRTEAKFFGEYAFFIEKAVLRLYLWPLWRCTKNAPEITAPVFRAVIYLLFLESVKFYIIFIALMSIGYNTFYFLIQS